MTAAGLYEAGMRAYLANPNPPSMRRYQRDLWRSIYEAVIPGVFKMHRAERQYRTGNLRRNVAAFLRRRDFKLPLPIRIRRKSKKANM